MISHVRTSRCAPNTFRQLPNLPSQVKKLKFSGMLSPAAAKRLSALAEKHSADFESSAAAPPQIADLHCFEIHHASSQSSAVLRSLLKTTFAHDWLCPSMRSDFLGQIWGNLSAKPCPSMPIRPQRGDGRHQPNLLLKKKKSISGGAPSQCPDIIGVCLGLSTTP